METENREIEKERYYLVVKSNDLIQKTRYSLSTQEQKVLLYLVSKIKPDDNDFQAYCFNLKHLCDVCGIEHNGKNYKNFKDSIKTLADKSFWIEDTNGKEYLCRWIHQVVIDKQDTNVYIRFDNILKPYLLKLKDNYTMYELAYILAMRSKYSIRLYEILKSYSFENGTEIELNKLKRLLDCEKYENRFDNMKTRVLNISKDEINKYSDIIIEYIPIKQNRTITSIKYTIRKKTLNETIETMIELKKMLPKIIDVDTNKLEIKEE